MGNRIAVNGSNLDLGDSIVTIKRTNPMFEDVGSYSLPFRIPRTKHNEEILLLNTISIHGGVRRFDAVIFLGPVPIYGSLVIISSSDSYYESYFTTGNATFRSLVSGVKLTDIDYTETIPGSGGTNFTVELTAAANSSYPTYNYTCFPMLAPEYYASGTLYKTRINNWSYSVSGGEFAYTGAGNNKFLWAPSFYLNFVLTKIFDEYGYSIESNALYDDTELRTLVIANFNTLGNSSTPNYNYELTFGNALPPIEINDYIASLENMFNITFFIDEISKKVNIKKNTSTVKAIPTKSFRLISRSPEYDDQEAGYTLKMEMDPGDSFAKVVDIAPYTLGLTVDNTEELEDAGNEASTYKGEMAFVSNNDLYYLSRLIDADADTWEWVALTHDFLDYKNGTGVVEYNTIANTIMMDNDDISHYYPTPSGNNEFALLPRVDNSAVNSEGRMEFKTFDTLRLLFYRGVVDSGGDITDETTVIGQYPLATPDVYRAQGVAGSPDPVFGRVKISTANQSLRWDGTYGLHATHWEDYLYWYNNLRKQSIDYYEMSLADIFSINFWEKYQAGGVSILFRSIEIEVDFAKNTVSAGKCEVYIS